MRVKRFILTFLLFALTALPFEAWAGESSIVKVTDNKYSYADMEKDLKTFAARYPAQAGLESLGKTADKRDLYCLRIGNPNAEKQIVVQACIHGREWLNCQVLMKMLERYLSDYESGSYKGMNYSQIFDRVAVYAIPMVNPDGVTISQYGIKKISDKRLRKKLKKIGGSYKRWKANAKGVDLNRNFPSGWARKTERKAPSGERYAGRKAGSENETKAVLRLIGRLSNLQACINYHSRGEQIYWGAKGKGRGRREAYKLAKMIRGITGYRLIDESKTYGAGGDLERYLIAKKKLPYLCIETGKEAAPLKHKSFSAIYKKNKTVIERVAVMFF